MINSSEAYTIASQYGSYMRDGDPGSVFYTFPPSRAAILDSDHRESLIAYTRECLAHANPEDTSELEDLLEYFQKAPAQDTPLWFTSSSGKIEFQMTLEQAQSMSHSGSCDDDVSAGRDILGIREQLAAIDPKTLRDELAEYGAWNDTELSDHDANLDRILWLAAGEIAEQNG